MLQVICGRIRLYFIQFSLSLFLPYTFLLRHNSEAKQMIVTTALTHKPHTGPVT